MQSYLKYGPWPFLLVGILITAAVACSSQVFVSDKGFIKVGIGTMSMTCTRLGSIRPVYLQGPGIRLRLMLQR